MLSEGDLVEYHIPEDSGMGYPERVGMLGIVVQHHKSTDDLCKVLWAPFAYQGPQWYSVRHLRVLQPGSLEALGEGGSSGGR